MIILSQRIIRIVLNEYRKNQQVQKEVNTVTVLNYVMLHLLYNQ